MMQLLQVKGIPIKEQDSIIFLVILTYTLKHYVGFSLLVVVIFYTYPVIPALMERSWLTLIN
jgi:hypothetical protein